MPRDPHRAVTGGARAAALSDWLRAAMGTALAWSNVSYGRITAVNPVDVANTSAQAGGALLGGTVGLVCGRNQSSSNQALRAGAGAFAGHRIARSTTGGQAF
jgi:outer membrane lipoprotein SlyB